MRSQIEPLGWDDRFDIDRDNWRDVFLLYERDLAIQKDLEYLSEAVFVFSPSILTSSSGRMTNSGEISARREWTVMEMF